MNYIFRITECQEYEIVIPANNYDEAQKIADTCVATGSYQNETPSEMYVSNIECVGMPN